MEYVAIVVFLFVSVLRGFLLGLTSLEAKYDSTQPQQYQIKSAVRKPVKDLSTDFPARRSFDEWLKNNKPKERYKWSLPVKYDRVAQWQRAQIRRQYIKEQDEKCYYCEGRLFKDPPEWVTIKPLNLESVSLEHPIHLHHCHKTGYTKGAVHAYCNGVLAQYHGE